MKRKTGRMLAALCALFMLFTAFRGVLTVRGESANDADKKSRLTMSADMAQRGGTVAVTISLTQNPGIWGLKFKAGYDHSVLMLTSVTNGIVFSDGDVTPPESLDKETYVFLACSNQLTDITKDGTVVTLNFLVADDAGLKDYPLTLEVTQAVNCAGDNIEIIAENAVITVTAGTTEPVTTAESDTEQKTEEADTGSKQPAVSDGQKESGTQEPAVTTAEQKTSEDAQTEPAKDEDDAETPAKQGGRIPVIVIVLLVVLAAAAVVAVYYFAVLYGPNRKGKNPKRRL